MRKSSYPETDVLGVGLGTILWQIGDEMWFPRNAAPNNAAPWPIGFFSKHLTCMETK